MPRTGPPLLLFDIDGTLVRKTGPHHRQVLVDALRDVTGLVGTTDHIPVQGMLDRDILAWMLRDAGAGHGLIRRSMPAIVDRAQQLYVRRCPDLKDRVCPGARALLFRLQRRGVRMALVTGNLSRIGWKKLERAGLHHHFAFGAFAEFGADRAELVARAMHQAQQRGLRPMALFGDHQNDILAAQANGLPVVSVLTGMSTRDELAALQPDFLLNDLRECPLEQILTA